MTAKPKEFYMPPAKLTAAIYKGQNLRRKMRETQLVLVNFSNAEKPTQFEKYIAGNKFADAAFIKVESKFEQLKVCLNNESVKLKIASEKWNAPCLIKRKPFEGNIPTYGFYYAAEKFIAVRDKAKNEFLDKNS